MVLGESAVVSPSRGPKCGSCLREQYPGVRVTDPRVRMLFRRDALSRGVGSCGAAQGKAVRRGLFVFSLRKRTQEILEGKNRRAGLHITWERETPGQLLDCWIGEIVHADRVGGTDDRQTMTHRTPDVRSRYIPSTLLTFRNEPVSQKDSQNSQCGLHVSVIRWVTCSRLSDIWLTPRQVHQAFLIGAQV